MVKKINLNKIFNKMGIYCIFNLKSKKRYIGKSVDIYKRILSHVKCLKNNSHKNRYLQNSWNKHGEKLFKFHILEECREEILCKRETFYIDFYDTCNSETGYNLTTGGERGFWWREDSVDRVSGENHFRFGTKKNTTKYFGVHRGYSTYTKRCWISSVNYKGNRFLWKTFSSELLAALHYDMAVIRNNLPHKRNFPEMNWKELFNQVFLNSTQEECPNAHIAHHAYIKKRIKI